MTPSDEERERIDTERMQRQPWIVDLLCALALIGVIGGGLAECTGAFDEPPPKCVETPK